MPTESDFIYFLNNPIIRVMLILLFLLTVQLVLRSSTDRIVERVVRTHRYANKNEQRQREDTLKKVFRTTSAILLWIVGIALVLFQLVDNLGALLTGAGLFSVVAGLSAQSLIKDYLAGFFIIMENQYRIDDIITLATPTATVSGVVEDISIRMTRLRDLDGNLHIVSNGTIGVITNQSYQFSSVNVDIKVSYITDIDLVEKLINEAGLATAADKKHKENIIEVVQFLRVDDLGESSVTVKAYGKVRPGSQWEVSGDFRRRLKKSFNKHHIPIPYPTALVHEMETADV